MRTLVTNLFFTICFALFCNQNVQAQAIHDAFELRAFLSEDYQLVEGTKAEKLYEILAKNLDLVVTNPTRDDIIDAYRSNPFISPLLTDNLGGPDVYQGKTGQRALGGGDIASSGLGLPSSTFLMGLTKFLVKRTKQELTIAFFRDFQKIVKESEEMKYLFPATSKVLLKIGEDIYRFKAFWDVLRESFLKDLDALVYNLDDYVQQSSRIKKPMVRYMMSDFFKIIELFYDKSTPADVINYLAEDAYLHTITPSIDSSKFIPVLQSSLSILGLFSKSLESQNTDGAAGYWVQPEKILDLIRTPILANLYLGLIYQQGKNIKVGKKSFAEHLATLSGGGNAEKARNLLNTFKAFLDKAKALQRLAKDMRTKSSNRRRNKNAPALTESDKELEYDNYFDFTQGICDMMLFAYDFKKELVGASNKEDSLVQQYLSIIGDINGLALSIRKKHYTSALMSTLFIIEKLLPNDQFACQRKVLLKYGTFIASAVNAKTSDEVSDVIAAFALPPGGSAIKKFSKFSIALNAYVGLAAGQEILNDPFTGSGTLAPSAFYAVTTPIGLTFNWGFKNFGSISILASVLDIGALTAFSFQNNGSGDIPELKFENVLAPGGYIVYGLPKYPVSIGIGAQLGPNLRSVTNGNLVTSVTSGFRWGAFIAVDIPMVSVYTTNKTYKQCPKVKCKDCNKKKKKK